MREIKSLDGLWRFLADLDPAYHDNDLYADVAWDRRHWEWVRVPGPWNKYGQRYAIFEGVCWFARSFTLERWSDEDVGVLRFGAVNYQARVYVNGQWAGEHQGGYTEFCLDVSGLLHAGENLLVLRVDNRRDGILLPACLGWFNYGGIHRSVQLEVSHGARLDWLGVTAWPTGDGAGLIVTGEIQTRAIPPTVVRLAVADAQGQALWQADLPLSQGADRFEHEVALAGLQPWSPNHPALYTLRAELLAADGHTLDSAQTIFGVRQVRVEGARILLNGEPIWLKGICYLPDHPATGMSHDAAIAARDLDALQALGVNALRFHVPLHPEMLAECDRRGILVWSEAPIYCLAPTEETGSAFAQEAYRRLGKQMLREMVRAAYNHPSVIIWSLGNECSVGHPEALGFFAALAETVRGLDSSRLVAYASLYGEMGQVGDLLDVIGVNEYWGWYDRIGNTPDKDRPLLQAIEEQGDGARLVRVAALGMARLERELEDKARRYHKPLLLTEFGADALPGYRAEDLHLWSEEYQAHCLERTIQALRGSPNVCGAFPFLYQDYPDPSKYVNTYWDGMNYKGIVSYDRQPKVAVETLRCLYANSQDEKGAES